MTLKEINCLLIKKFEKILSVGVHLFQKI